MTNDDLLRMSLNQGKKFKSGRLSKRPLATSRTCIGARLGDSTVY